jgi:hypothetical protein
MVKPSIEVCIDVVRLYLGLARASETVSLPSMRRFVARLLSHAERYKLECGGRERVMRSNESSG